MIDVDKEWNFNQQGIYFEKKVYQSSSATEILLHLTSTQKSEMRRIFKERKK